MTVALAGALVLFMAAPVRVESKDCPTGFDVEQALSLILFGNPERVPDPETPATLYRAVIERAGTTLRVALVDAKAVVIAERVFEARDKSCSELAELAAIVIAIWASDVHPELGTPPEPLQTPSSAAPAVAPSVMASALPSASFDIGLGASITQAGSFAAAGTLAGFWIPRGKGFGLRMVAVGELSRTLDLGTAEARWRRFVGAAELAWRWVLGAWTLDPHAGIALGWLVASGDGFSEDRSGVSMSPAAAGGLRLAWWAAGPVAGWLDVSGMYWMRVEAVYEMPGGHERELPRLEGIASVGLAWGRARTAR